MARVAVAASVIKWKDLPGQASDEAFTIHDAAQALAKFSGDMEFFAKFGITNAAMETEDDEGSEASLPMEACSEFNAVAAATPTRAVPKSSPPVAKPVPKSSAPVAKPAAMPKATPSAVMPAAATATPTQDTFHVILKVVDTAQHETEWQVQVLCLPVKSTTSERKEWYNNPEAAAKNPQNIQRGVKLEQGMVLASEVKECIHLQVQDGLEQPQYVIDHIEYTTRCREKPAHRTGPAPREYAVYWQGFGTPTHMTRAELNAQGIYMLPTEHNRVVIPPAPAQEDVQ